MVRALVFGLMGLLAATGLATAGQKETPRPGKEVVGTFQAYKEGVLTVKLQAPQGEESKTQEFRVEDETRVVLFEGQERKELTGKDSFKDVKEGVPVTIRLGENDKIMTIRLGTPPAGEKDR